MLSTRFSKINRRHWFLVLLTLICAMALASCNPTNLKTEAAQVPQVVDSVLSDPKTFNYALSQESPNVASLIYEGLVSENGNGELEPALAEAWEISPDKQRIIFTLREGLKWCDGEPLTVDDVVFTYNDIYLNEKIPTDIRDILRIGRGRALPRVRKVDERRVEFTIPEPFAPFLRYTGGLAILPAHALQEYLKTTDSQGKLKFLSTWGTNTDPKKIISNGPYQLESYQTSERVVFRRNPYYWRKDAQGNQQPYIERYIWQIVENTDTAFIQFRSGGLDTLTISPEYFSLLKQEEKRGKFKIYVGGPELSTTFLVFNLNKAKNSQNQPLVDPIKSRWFNTLEFRQAIAHAIDRQKMLNNLYRGLGEPQNSPIYKQSPYYLSPEQGLKVYDYNPKKAKELLRKAGFRYNENELLDADGNRVRFTMLTNAGNKLREAIGAQIKEDLAQIGMQVDFQAIAFGTLLDKVYKQRQWDSYIGKIGGGGVEPNGGANTWSTTGGLHTFNLAPQPGGQPLIGWEATDWEKEIEELYIKGAGELDETKRKAIYVETQRVTQENLPFIYLVNPLTMETVRDRVGGVKYSALGGAFWNIYELKVTISP